MQRRLKKPRKVRVNPWLVVIRKYGDVKCGYCSFRGANHKGNFNTEYNPKYRNMTPCCHACAKRRRLERMKKERLETQILAAESKARRSRKMVPAPKKTKSKYQRTVRQTATRVAAVKARVRRTIMEMARE